MKTNLIIAALGVALASIGLNAYAVSSKNATAPLAPTVTITNACSVVVQNTAATGALRTPPAVSGTVNLDAVIGTVTVTDCSNTFKLGADAGNNPSTTRQLVSTGTPLSGGTLPAYVAYTLGVVKLSGDGTSTPITTTTDWGTNGMTAIAKPFAAKDALTVTGAGATGAADVFTISARFAITGTATSPADVYSDSVIVGVEF